jgi:hypothetical protein
MQDWLKSSAYDDYDGDWPCFASPSGSATPGGEGKASVWLPWSMAWAKARSTAWAMASCWNGVGTRNAADTVWWSWPPCHSQVEADRRRLDEMRRRGKLDFEGRRLLPGNFIYIDRVGHTETRISKPLHTAVSYQSVAVECDCGSTTTGGEFHGMRKAQNLSNVCLN